MYHKLTKRTHMNKDKIDWVFFVIAAFAIATLIYCFTSCKTPQPIVQDQVKEIHTETIIHDTVVTIEPDTAAAQLLLECDSIGNVRIVQLEQEQGKRIAMEMELQRIQDRLAGLKITCKEDSLQRIIELQRERIQELKVDKIMETKVERYIPDFYRYSTWGFWIIVGISLLILAFKAYKWWLKRKIPFS